jgi:hypothetical protein
LWRREALKLRRLHVAEDAIRLAFNSRLAARCVESWREALSGRRRAQGLMARAVGGWRNGRLRAAFTSMRQHVIRKQEVREREGAEEEESVRELEAQRSGNEG